MDFPSGPWTGFYHYGVGTGRHRMDLALTFANGTISGDGIDDAGPFLISGRDDSQSGECHWTKTYFGAHSVYYRGFREGKGIWGLWELALDSGRFQIWPLGEDESAAIVESVEEPAPSELCAPQARRCRGGSKPVIEDRFRRIRRDD